MQWYNCDLTVMDILIIVLLLESLAQMQAMPEAALTNPFQTAALTVYALCVYSGYSGQKQETEETNK